MSFEYPFLVDSSYESISKVIIATLRVVGIVLFVFFFDRGIFLLRVEQLVFRCAVVGLYGCWCWDVDLARNRLLDLSAFPSVLMFIKMVASWVPTFLLTLGGDRSVVLRATDDHFRN